MRFWKQRPKPPRDDVDVHINELIEAALRLVEDLRATVDTTENVLKEAKGVVCHKPTLSDTVTTCPGADLIN